MLPGMELMACANLAVPREVMHHVVRVESSFNPYAIGVVGGRLVRQPRSLPEALSTARMLERDGYNFSLGLAQVNRYNLAKQGLGTYEKAFEVCPNLQAGSRILAECFGRSGNSWGKAFSCYYSGNFVTGFRHGYVQKVVSSWRQAAAGTGTTPIAVVRTTTGARATGLPTAAVPSSLVARRVAEAAGPAVAESLRPTPEAALARAVAPSINQPPLAQPLPQDDAPNAPVLVQPMSRSGAQAAQPQPRPHTVSLPEAVATTTTSPPANQRDDAFVF